MRRRDFLRASAAAGICATAGCTNTGSSDGTGSPSNESTTSPDSDGQADGDDPREIPKVARVDTIEFSASQMYLKEYLRYYDEEVGAVERLSPANDFFLEATYRWRNLEGEAWTPPPESAVELVNGVGAQTEYLESLPNGVTWDQIRLREEHSVYWLDPSTYDSEEVPPGEGALVYALYDATIGDRYWLRTEAEGQVLRSSPDAILVPDSV